MYLSAQTSPEWTSGNAKKWMKSAVWSNGWTVSPINQSMLLNLPANIIRTRMSGMLHSAFLPNMIWKRCPLATMSFWRGNAGLRSVNTFPKRWRKGILKVTSVCRPSVCTLGNERWAGKCVEYVRRIIQKGCCFLYLFPDKHYSADAGSFFLFSLRTFTSLLFGERGNLLKAGRL